MTLIMPASAWDTLATCCFNRKVLYIGVDDGDDVASVAQVATITAVYPGVAPADLGRYFQLIEHLHEAYQATGLAGRVLLHQVVALLGITQYHPGAFDVAVFNPAAAGSAEIAQDLEMIAAYARVLVVVDGPGLPHWDEITAATRKLGLIATGYDDLVVAVPAPSEPIVRRD